MTRTETAGSTLKLDPEYYRQLGEETKARIEQAEAMGKMAAGLPLEDILRDRGTIYGPFSGHALLSQTVKAALITPDRRSRLGVMCREGNITDEQLGAVLEGTEMIAHKLARLWNGDPLHLDSWDDIAGYATITARVLRGEL